MNTQKRIKFHDYWLTPAQYDSVKDTVFIDEPTPWENQLVDEALTTVIAVFKSIMALGIEDDYVPESSSVRLGKIVDSIFDNDIITSAFDNDEILIEETKECLKGIPDPDVELKVVLLLEILWNDLEKLIYQSGH